MRRFKTKKRKKYLKLFVWLFIFVLFIQIFILPFKNYEIKKSNESFVLKLINGTNHYLETNHDKIFTNVVNKILNVDFSKPVSLVSKSFDYNEEETVFMVNIDSTLKEIDNNVTNPRVYIYSSHQSEGYNNEYDVVKASVKLKETLEKFKINTIVEEGNIIEFMRVNNYIHAYSYIASRYFIEPVIKKNNFDLIIDLHRDSNSKESSTVTIDGKNFAKVLFVVGLENVDKNATLYIVNHQGRYDGIGALSALKDFPCSFIADKKRICWPFYRELSTLLEAIELELDNPRSEIKALQEMSEGLINGRSYLAFIEGKYEDNGNNLQEFKTGVLKTAYRAKVKITPVVLYDTYLVYGKSSIKKISPEIHFLKPIEYEDFAEINRKELADIIKEKMQNEINIINTRKGV